MPITNTEKITIEDLRSGRIQIPGAGSNEAQDAVFFSKILCEQYASRSDASILALHAEFKHDFPGRDALFDAVLAHHFTPDA